MAFFWDELPTYGSELALIDADGRRVTYRELIRGADGFARGLGSRRLLLLEIDNHSSAIAAYVGALRAGHPIILARPGDEEAARRIHATFAPELAWSRATGLVEHARRTRGDLHPDLALALSTSGSTGSTKLVRLSGRAIDANARSIAQYLDLCSSERAITSLPPSYSYGLSVVNSHLAVGASLVLTDASVVDEAFWELVDRHRATSLAGVPHTYELLESTRFVRSPPPTLRTFTQAGGRLAPDRVQRFGRLAREHDMRFFVMYGQTEAAPRIAYVPPDELPSHPDCIGRAIPGGRLELGNPVDGRGELVYRGPNVMMGYATSREDLGRGSEIEALRTGDLAEEVAPGLYRLVGRLSRFAKTYGLRISLDEIEAHLAALGYRAFAASDDKLICVFIEGAGEAASVAGALAGRLHLPAAVFRIAFGGHRPLLSSGKTDYAAILARAKGAEAIGATDLANADRMTEAFARLFPGQKLSGQDSFATLGGDSLNYVTAAATVEEALGDLPDRWESLTLAELDARVEARRSEQRVRAARIHVEGETIARCLAIASVVMAHASQFTRWSDLSPRGGTDVFMLLFGFNVIRFQGPRLLRGDTFQVLKHHLKLFGIPYLAATCLVFLVKGELEGARLLLVSNYRGYHGGPLGFLWFFEALIQMSVVLAVLFKSSTFARGWRSAPWIPFAVVVFAAGVKLAGRLVYDPVPLEHRTPDALFFLFAAGMALAAYRQGVIAWGLASFVIVLELATWGVRDTHAPLVALAAAILLSLRRPALPRWLGMTVRKVAASSLYIYLASPVIAHVFWRRGGDHPLLMVCASFGAGLLLDTLARLPRPGDRHAREGAGPI